MIIKKIKSKIDNNFVYYCDLFIIYLTYNNEFIHELDLTILISILQIVFFYP